MEHGVEFLELMHLQDEPEMITKSELLERVRRRGARISDRLLTYYAAEALIPKSVRIGTRAGAYPAMVEHLLAWVILQRERGLSVDAIKELVPLWKFLKRAEKEGTFDLREFEELVQTTVHTPEGMFALPGVVTSAVCPHCLSRGVWTLKDGTEVKPSQEPDKALLGFLVEEALTAGNAEDEEDEPIHLYTRLALPVEKEDQRNDPATIVVELPPRVRVEDEESELHQAPVVQSEAAKVGGA